MVTAAAVGRGELAAALCGPPTDFFLLGRHDLADVVRPLLACCGEPAHRRAVLSRADRVGVRGTDPRQLQAYADEVAEIDAARPTGLGAADAVGGHGVAR